MANSGRGGGVGRGGVPTDDRLTCPVARPGPAVGANGVRTVSSSMNLHIQRSDNNFVSSRLLTLTKEGDHT